MMDYKEQTYEAIMARALVRVPSDVDKREGSVVYDAMAPLAVELAEFYSYLSAEMDRAFPDTAAGEDLTNKAKERGLFRLSATAAVRKGVFTDQTGRPKDVPVGARFSGGNVNYAAAEKMETGVFKLAAEEPGSAGNEYFGILFPIDHIEGLGGAELSDILVHGEDREEDEALRARYMASLESIAFGGNVADYRERTKALPGVGGVKVYRAWNGGGTVKLVVTTSAGGVPSGELLAQVQEAVDPVGLQGEGRGFAPIDHCVTVAGARGLTVDVGLQLTFVQGYAWEGVKDAVRAAIQGYLDEVIAAWENEAASTVRVGHIEARVLEVSGVLDAAGTTLNGVAGNLALEEDQIPLLGEVTNRAQ